MKINTQYQSSRPNEYEKDKTHNFNPFPNKPWFLRVCSTSLLKTLWGKEKFPTVFYTFGGFYGIFIQFEIVVYKLFQFGRF